MWDNYTGPTTFCDAKCPPATFSHIHDERYKVCERIAYPSWPNKSLWEDKEDQEDETDELPEPIYLDQAIKKMEDGHLQGCKIPCLNCAAEPSQGLTKPKKLNMVLDFGHESDDEACSSYDPKPEIWAAMTWIEKNETVASKIVLVKPTTIYENGVFTKIRRT